MQTLTNDRFDYIIGWNVADLQVSRRPSWNAVLN